MIDQELDRRLSKIEADISIIITLINNITQVQLRHTIAFSKTSSAMKVLVKKVREDKGQLEPGEAINGDLMDAYRDAESIPTVLRSPLGAWSGEVGRFGGLE
jgi:hypothetical protein